MSRKQRGQGPGAKPSNRNGGGPTGHVANGADPDSRFAADRFRANVLTWTGPGIENIFIDFEPARQRKLRILWKDGDPHDHGEARERADHNA